MTFGRRTTSVVVAIGVIASAALIGGAALPWHQSGSRVRNAFALARVADDLGLVDTGPRRVLLVAVFLLPLLAALALLAMTLDRRRVAGGFTAFAGIVGLTSAAVDLNLSGSRLVGPAVTIAAGLVAVGCGAHLVLKGDQRRE
jgi:hypothetical protein